MQFKKTIRLLTLAAAALAVVSPAQAELQGRDISGLAVAGGSASAVFLYDTDLNITWLRDANYAKTSGYDADGRMFWATANTWANSLVFGGFDDWRLPTTTVQTKGFNQTGSEMGHLWYSELHNTANVAITNKGSFQNLQVLYPTTYWSSTVYEPNPYGRWSFDVAYGLQDANCQGCEYFSMAVRSGDVLAAVPEPETWALLLAGLGLVTSIARRRKTGQG